jgi:hypothetical protein
MNIYWTFVFRNFYSKSSIETIRTQFKSSAWASCGLPVLLWFVNHKHLHGSDIMAPIEQFTILLNEGRTFYQPGDEVIGKVFLRLRGEMAIRRVTVGFHGEGHVRRYKNRTHYHYTQPYFHYSCVVYDCNNETQSKIKCLIHIFV